MKPLPDIFQTDPVSTDGENYHYLALVDAFLIHDSGKGVVMI